MGNTTWIDNRNMRDRGYEGPLAIEDKTGHGVTKEQAEEKMIHIIRSDYHEAERRISNLKSQIEKCENVMAQCIDALKRNGKSKN